MKSIDLHVHSTFSDGTNTPKELVQLAVKSDISAFALTDHDTTKGIDEALNAMAEANKSCPDDRLIEVIPGVEISTSFDNTEIHILGLFINHKDREFNDFLDSMLLSRENRNKEVCIKFQEIGINITYEDMLNAYPDAVITRAHFADRLVQLKLVGDRNEAFDRYLSPSKPCFVPRVKIEPKEAVNRIHKAGGLAILAHPILYHLGNEQFNRLIDYLCESGIDGIEAVYSTYKPSDERKIRRIAKERNLLITGGSDYHGDNKPNIKLGKGLGHLFIHEEILDGLKKSISN